ncbi:threonine-phosphate decarboxylase CobD [Alkalihalobacillus macyae]|uniref:threonine-phosphate decarboxylase CobD n=1 Tax=Guptibacillus hwajinpoensis TaxID=208199 RepID=UPI00273B553C|nr:threonine-phosphate decarboxylase CobD [Alkalihalobacillus macyae]MDP4551636.1 threonine-phosphate decarboxylase CobD [Alkalihalobacillus macyae]
MALPSHGSNPHYLYESLNLSQPEQFIDFSANLNPFGPPPALKEKWREAYELITTYPDPNASTLTSKLATQCHVEENQLLIGNGGAELITLVGRFLAGKRVCIVQPAFSEYEAACRSAGCDVIDHTLKEGEWHLNPEHLIEKMDHLDAIFLCTPNNPTGVVYERDSIMALLRESEKRNCFLILDEAFVDFLSDDATYAQAIPTFSKLIILRSLTKMYAIPGLRLGYMIAQADVISAIKALQPHWSVNALALMAGELCFKQEDHVTKTRELIEQERRKLHQFFKENNYIHSTSSVNFYLLKDSDLDDQTPLLRFLMKSGIVPRHTENFPGLDGRWLRFAIRTQDENRELMEVLRKWRR